MKFTKLSTILFRNSHSRFPNSNDPNVCIPKVNGYSPPCTIAKNKKKLNNKCLLIIFIRQIFIHHP